MHKEIVASLVKSNQYFTELNTVSYSRTIGINDYGLKYDDNFIFDRQNIWYFSDEFKEIYKNNLTVDIVSLFNTHKDNLKDLAWIIYGYY